MGDLNIELVQEAEAVDEQPQALPSIVVNDVKALISQGIEKGLAVENMERLLALYERVQAIKAKEEYTRALSEFQRRCPAIVKNKQGYQSKYAPLDSIIAQVKDLLYECGFSFTVKTEQVDNKLISTCFVHHVGGHTAESSIPMPIENNKNMTGAQHIGSARTYGMRYAFCDAFGIMTCDEDDDGNAGRKKEDTEKNQPPKQPQQNSQSSKEKNAIPEENKAVMKLFASLINEKYKGVDLFTKPEKIEAMKKANVAVLNLEALTDLQKSYNKIANDRREKMQGAIDEKE